MTSENYEVVTVITEDTLVGKWFMKFISHPLDYSRFLAQVIHKPLNLYHYKSIFGKEYWFLPNLFIYGEYIYSKNGLKGMYAGLSPRLLEVAVEHFSRIALSDYIKFDGHQKGVGSKNSDFEVWKKCAILTAKKIIFTAASTILSHPLHVVSMRIMAQVVGLECRYTSVGCSLLLIYREEGLNGLFAGIVPRLLEAVGTVILVNVAKQAFLSYGNRPNSSLMTAHAYGFISSFFIRTVTYPFEVVTACSAVNNCGLVVGMPPDMPVFGNWVDCMKYMYKMDNLQRGSLLWFRRSNPFSIRAKP